ncbi:MAG: tRNA lysidine(34) synthetase TilS [Saonia sp.]
MVREFENHIKDRFPELYDDRFLLACSGGIDSMVLAHLCASCKLNFAIAHCNFGLRGDESDADEKFVKEFAKNLNHKFYVNHFDTDAYVRGNKVSVQMAARELRYQWFTYLMQEKGFKTLVTAHQADDNLETFLINLSRGTGIDGLIGIPERTDTIARPLLKFSREQLLKYAKAIRMDWREDSSNRDTKYLRNKIRHQLVPGLKELHPTFLDNFQRTQHYLVQTSDMVEAHVGTLKTKLFQKDGDMFTVAIASLLELHPLKAYMYALFKAYGFTEWNNILGLLSATSGKEVRSKTHRLVKDRERLLLQPLVQYIVKTYKIEENQTTIKEPIQLTIDEIAGIGKTSEKILYADKETLKYPLTIRKWKKGDYFYPFGMKGGKKISKFFKDEKMDIIAKGEQWLLCSDDAIVWVIGKRADNRFRVTDNTKSILKFSLQE